MRSSIERSSSPNGLFVTQREDADPYSFNARQGEPNLAAETQVPPKNHGLQNRRGLLGDELAPDNHKDLLLLDNSRDVCAQTRRRRTLPHIIHDGSQKRIMSSSIKHSQSPGELFVTQHDDDSLFDVHAGQRITPPIAKEQLPSRSRDPDDRRDSFIGFGETPARDAADDGPDEDGPGLFKQAVKQEDEDDLVLF